jgi:glucosamine--fructose-6-phosphate aminotransferase (isomerizing)
MSTRTELGEGPDVIARLLDRGSAPVEAIARAVRDRGIDLVVVAARGTSDHAAIYAQYVLGARNRLPVALAAPSLASIYGATPRLHNALVLGISQSGQSPDIVAVLEDARRQGALTVAVTNDPASALAVAAEHTVPIHAGPELGVAATKTYLASIAVIAMLSGALSGDAGSRAELAALPDAVRAALGSEDQVKTLAASRAGDDRCVVLARGFQYATARELALKVKELAYVLADPYSAADFQHGPIALVTPGFPVIAVATTGPAMPGLLDLLGRLRAGKARLLVISDADEALAMGDGVALPRGVPEWLAPIVAIVPGQLYAYHLAEARGIDPDRPRNLSKVTLTR